MGARALPEAKELFWERMDQGWSAGRAGVSVGVSAVTGCRWARAAGRNRPAVKPVRDPVAVRCLVVLLGRGVGPGRAARMVGLPGRSGYWLAKRLAEGRGLPDSALWDDSAMVVDVDAPRGLRLTVREREQIMVCRAAGMTMRATACRIGRSVSTVSREITRNSGVDGCYRGLDAHKVAWERARRPKVAKLHGDTVLRGYVSQLLMVKCSPEEIARRLRLEYPDNVEMRVCHETIYQALYVEARGGLKREVEKTLRRGCAYRCPRRRPEERRGRIPGMVSISERPPEVEDRAVPGNWEGDLIIGKDSTAVATLVERMSRYILLAHLDSDHTAPTVRDALIRVLGSLPDELRRSLTWDQGREMACHLQLAAEADIDIYFADPHSPWQRGTNENTNGLLRQYMPKGTDLSVHTPEDLQAIADELNNRPRKVLGWLTPNEAMHLILGHQVIIGGRVMRLPDSFLPLAQRPYQIPPASPTTKTNHP